MENSGGAPPNGNMDPAHEGVSFSCRLTARLNTRPQPSGFRPRKTSCTGPQNPPSSQRGPFARTPLIIGACSSAPKTRRFAPPPHGGAEGLDPDSARAVKAAMGERRGPDASLPGPKRNVRLVDCRDVERSSPSSIRHRANRQHERRPCVRRTRWNDPPCSSERDTIPKPTA